ncbi:MAG: isoprenyl transferase [Deltaproteobacteria bacterium]|nr:isoprenyl transferase [Deltaproteobacteria bacterium]
MTAALELPKNLPTHVAIIMDGNGRWAKKRGGERVDGHKAGAQTVREIVTFAREIGIRYLTLYAFSSENWGRPEDEINALMKLLSSYLTEEKQTLLDNDIELFTIGETKKLPLVVRGLLTATKAATRNLGGMRLTLALSYGARDEMVQAVQSIAKDVKKGKLKPTDINEDTISQRLHTKDMPDPDLLLRTSGERRISNFLLWQLAYSELSFIEMSWPEFSKEAFVDALHDYASRQRRFGLIGAQTEDDIT